jgi:hypothetical protein
MSIPKRHHFVSQMLLNGFTDRDGWRPKISDTVAHLNLAIASPGTTVAASSATLVRPIANAR